MRNVTMHGREARSELRRISDATESSALTLAVGMMAIFAASALAIFVYDGPPLVRMLLFVPVAILGAFLYFMAEEWAGHRRKLNELRI